jgi:uncharacterized membrane protein YeaQ/YmgE (transglycosylase-associated protein family)
MAITMGPELPKVRRPCCSVLTVKNLKKMESEMVNSKLDLIAFGWALSGALVVLLIICEAAAIILPGWQLTHGWLALFSNAEPGSFRNLIEGVIASIIFGWVTATVLASIYNRLIRSKS